MYDNQQTRRWCLRTIGGAVGGAALLGTASADEHLQAIEVELTGEAAGVETEAGGLAVFRPDLEAGEIHYRLDLRNICNVTMAHIHEGGPDEDGPPVVWLYPEEGQAPELVEGRFSGTLAEGTFTPDDFVGPWEGLTLEEAHTRVAEDGAYVNVHTEEHPAGEIRGQIPVEEMPEEPPADGDGDGDDDADDEQPPDDDDGDDDTDDGDDDMAVDVGEALEVVEVNREGAYPEDENIVLRNTSDQDIDLSGYEIWDREGGAVEDRPNPDGPFVFEDFVLGAGDTVTIWTGEGEDDDENLYWDQSGYSQQVWREEGDVVRIFDPEGNLVLRYGYGDEGEGADSISIAHRIGFSRSDPSARFSRFRF